MRLRPLLVSALALAAAACATVPRLEAANDIHAFLVAVRDGDRTGFDAHVDRGALKTQLRSRVLGETARDHGAGSWATLGAALAGPLVDVGVEALVQPAVFRAEAVRIGYDPAKPIPGALALAAFVRPVGDGRVCVTTVHGGPCVFDFNDEGGAWRLTGYEGPLRLPDASPSPKRPRA